MNMFFLSLAGLHNLEIGAKINIGSQQYIVVEKNQGTKELIVVS